MAWHIVTTYDVTVGRVGSPRLSPSSSSRVLSRFKYAESRRMVAAREQEVAFEEIIFTVASGDPAMYSSVPGTLVRHAGLSGQSLPNPSVRQRVTQDDARSFCIMKRELQEFL